MTTTRTKPPAILLLEHDSADAELAVAAIRRFGFGQPTVVATRDQFISALAEHDYDVVVSDYRLPGWNGMGALGVLRELGFDAPFILLTGTLGDEQAVDCVRAGVADYVLKNNLGRLAVSIPRVIEERRQKQRVAQAHEAIRQAEDRAQAVRGESEEWFRALLDNSADGIALLTAEGKFRYLSPSTGRLLGGDPASLLGHSFAPLIHPDDVDNLGKTFQWVATGAGRRATVECRARHSDGSWRWFESFLTNLLDDQRVGGVVSNFRDITERYRSHAALRESEERFREIAEHIKEAFFVVDVVQGRTLYVSPTWGEIWGRPIAQGYDSHVWMEAVHPDDRQSVIESQAAVSRGVPSDGVFRVHRPDGEVRWVRGRVYPVKSAAGVVTRMVGVSSDITELRRAEQRFQQAQKMEAMGRLAGGVAHDFNNLLTVIIGLADHLHETAPDGSEGKEMSRDIFNAGQSAAVLTRQLLAFSRKQLIEPTVLSLDTVIGETVKMLRRMIGEDVELKTRLAADVGHVRADRGQLEQLLTNLAVNARDAMPMGGTLTVETRDTVVDAGDAGARLLPVGRYATLLVTDTGTGMTEDVRSRIFEPFFTTKEVGKGTGLGLATCHGIVEQAGGHIDVRSAPREGTTFTIHLPVVELPPTPKAASAPVTPRRGRETVLLVEDEEIVRRAGSRMLRSLGYDVLEAADGAAAQALLREHGAAVRLLLTDVVLPGITGRQLAEIVSDRYPSIRILFASGYNDDVILQHKLLSHHVALLPKPYTIASMAAKVREVLDA